MGTFGDDALPYWLDHKTDTELENSVPTLAAMTAVAIDHLKGSKEGYVLQIEGGKVDWAAHANDIGGLLFEDKVEDVVIQKDHIHFDNIHTVTLYINPSLQKQYYDYILGLHPKRIIFNPGTENDELLKLANNAGILTEYACTLVLLRLNQY